MITNEAYKALEEAVGSENVNREPAVLDGYAWQPTINDDPAKWVFRPVAVVLPASTEDVQAVVRVCNEHGLKFKAFATGWAVYSAPSSDGVVILDLRRMNKIIEIDEKNMYAIVDPYVSGAQLQAEAMKVGLNTHIIGAGPVCSPLASATSGWGVGWDCIYMSYSARNVLGVEWVLPSGEILRLGTPGSDLGWFSGDGPGPSLRGIMRGSSGALGGHGVFTRCALKLYNWPGPPQLQTDGLLIDAQSEIPENMKFHICFFPDRKALADATYKIGDSEIGYLATRTSINTFLYGAAPNLFRKVTKTSALRDLLSKTFKWSFIIVLAGDSKGDIDYQQSALKDIIADYGGITMEMMDVPVIGPVLPMNFLRVTAIPTIFRLGGLFTTALPRNETWDNQLDWADVGEKMRVERINKGELIDDMGDNPFMALYENNSWSHCENIFMYDARNKKHLKSLETIFTESAITAIEMCMEPLSSFDLRLKKVLSPILGNFNHWQKKISKSFDPNRAADSGMYSDEMDYDLSGGDPKLKEKLEKLIKERKGF